MFPIIFQHTVSSGPFYQVAGLNSVVDDAFIKMPGVGGDIKIHDSGKGDNEQDDQKGVKLKAQTLKAQTPYNWQDFFKEYSLRPVFHLFILRKATQEMAKVP
ncbi:MAG: hypothetical protein Q7U55_03165 [Deltaproteobacteria bacterium]|nr:hypothetical protein [Deltaproteobacteria bacterium]